MELDAAAWPLHAAGLPLTAKQPISGNPEAQRLVAAIVSLSSPRTALRHRRAGAAFDRSGSSSGAAPEQDKRVDRAGGLVTLVHRGPGFGESVKYWVKPDIENRVKEGSIAARFNTRVVEIRPTNILVEHDSTTSEIDADAVIVATPDHMHAVIASNAFMTFGANWQK